MPETLKEIEEIRTIFRPIRAVLDIYVTEKYVFYF